MLFCYSNSSYRFLAPDAWANSQPANMAQIQDLEVQCEKDLFRVRIKFDRPFYGMVFSKGFYSNVNCVHVPAGLGQTQATFDIAMGQVGTSGPSVVNTNTAVLSLEWLNNSVQPSALPIISSE